MNNKNQNSYKPGFTDNLEKSPGHLPDSCYASAHVSMPAIIHHSVIITLPTSKKHKHRHRQNLKKKYRTKHLLTLQPSSPLLKRQSQTWTDMKILGKELKVKNIRCHQFTSTASSLLQNINAHRWLLLKQVQQYQPIISEHLECHNNALKMLCLHFKKHLKFETFRQKRNIWVELVW